MATDRITKDDILFSHFMKQEEDFSVFYEKFTKENGDTSDSTTFLGKTPQKTIGAEDEIDEEVDEEVDEEPDEEEIKAVSNDYSTDDGIIKSSRYQS